MRGIKNMGTSRMLLGICFLFFYQPMTHAEQRHKQEYPNTVDSTFVFTYRPQVQMFQTALGKNHQLLKELSTSLQTFRKGTDTIYVEGYSGAFDNEHTNRTTAFWRCVNLKGFLINTKKLRERDFKTINHPYAHNTLGEVVILSLVPFTEPLVKDTASVTEPIVTSVSDSTKESVSDFTKEKEVATTVHEEMPSKNHSNDQQSDTRYYALKTNLVAWAGTILNVAVDVQVGKHISLELPVLWCPWYVSNRHAIRTFTIQPEARYWLSAPGKGHFFGLHAHVSWFNVKWNDNRYQDIDRPLLGAGISYGYLLPLSTHWAAEFTLGAGYANMKYDTYYNINNGVRFDTGTKNYWGITRAGISFVYRFNAARP